MANEQTSGTNSAKPKTEPTQDDTPMIVYRETYFEGNVQKSRVHGPMPVSEWAEYERQNNL